MSRVTACARDIEERRALSTRKLSRKHIRQPEPVQQTREGRRLPPDEALGCGKRRVS